MNKPEAQMKAAFDTFDTDHDGCLDTSEFSQLVKAFLPTCDDRTALVMFREALDVGKELGCTGGSLTPEVFIVIAHKYQLFNRDNDAQTQLKEMWGRKVRQGSRVAHFNLQPPCWAHEGVLTPPVSWTGDVQEIEMRRWLATTNKTHGAKFPSVIRQCVLPHPQRDRAVLQLPRTRAYPTLVSLSLSSLTYTGTLQGFVAAGAAAKGDG